MATSSDCSEMIKSKHSIEVFLPIDEVMDLFKNQDYFRHWQKGLVHSNPLKGEPGRVNSTREMSIKVAGTLIKMKEEITTVNLPHLWEATYRTKGVVNEQSNRFRESEKIINNKSMKITLWDATSTFKFTGLMRLVGKAQPQLFKNQTLQHMQDFKTFAENQEDFLSKEL